VKRITLLPIGEVADALLEDLCAGLSLALRKDCEVLRPGLDVAQALNASRQQYSSTAILARMQVRLNPQIWRMLGVTSLDLYIPILTFVFGEAQLDGACAIVSTHRLRQEFYGLPSDPKLLGERLLKEAVHELGHTLALTHCADYRCVMAPAHALERIDVKESNFCKGCRARVSPAEACRSS